MEDGHYFLKSPEFQTLDPDHVMLRAREKLEQMLFIVNLKIDEFCNADVIDVEFNKKVVLNI